MQFQRFCLIFLLIIGTTLGSFAQKDVLFTVDGDKVYTDEFKYVYEKNNRNDGNLYSEASVLEYLDLYVNFKLKVKEADVLKLDNNPAFQSELKRYRKQLADSYLNEREITDDLLKEAYNNTKEERKIAHLLMLCGPEAPPADTLRIFEEMKIIREEIRSGGKTFEKAAQVYSEDKATKPNGGDLGYITAFSTIYDFENIAFQTPIGGLSPIFRTRYGYHLLTTTDIREAKGKIEAAHILLKVPKFANDKQKAEIKQKIQGFYDDIDKEKGENFEMYAKRYSEDKSTAPAGGSLGWFGVGTWVRELDDVAFGLENIGDYSMPFETEYGWHIVKLLNKRPIGTYSDMKEELIRKVKKDSRSKASRQKFIDRLKKDFEYNPNEEGYKSFVDRLDVQSFLSSRYTAPTSDDLKLPVFKISGAEYTQYDFAKYIEKNQRKKKITRVKDIYKRADILYKDFVASSLVELERNSLESKYPDFKRLMQEYRDGILLFDLTKDKVWDKAANDTVGLEAFYEQNKTNYLYDTRLRGKIITCPDEATARALSTLLVKREKKIKKGKNVKPFASFLAAYNEKASGQSSFKKGTYEKGDNDIVDSIKWEAGISRTIKKEDGRVIFVLVEEIVEPTPKPLSETKGYVISDYQTQLEKDWIAELKQKYPVVIKEKTLRSLYN